MAVAITHSRYFIFHLFYLHFTMADEDLLIDYEHEETAVAAAGEEKDTKK